METRHKVVRYLLGAVGVVFIMSLVVRHCAPPIYFAKAMSGRVVDAETKQPIAGVVVVAEWIPMTVLYPDRTTPLCVFETVTNANGYYIIPSWGPRLRVPLTRLTNRDPELLLFKNGYRHRALFNERDHNSVVRSSDWDGQTIELQVFQGTPKTRLDQLRVVLSEAGVGAGRLENLFDEILKEAPLPVAGAQPFFEGIRELKQRGM